MPHFPSCPDVKDKAKAHKCYVETMNKFIQENLRYPEIAKENGVEGVVVVRFVVEKDGQLTNIKVVRDIGAQCGEEAKRIVETMPTWVPGMQRGRKVRVQYNLPVKFDLSKE